MDELISVIIPVYNVEKYVERAIKSVMEQTYTNLEIILIDDGSKDSSGEICDKIAKQDNRIKVIHQQNMGLSGARNTGIKNANGKYIAFVDSDDIVSNRMYEFMYKAIKQDKTKISACRYISFDEDIPNFDENYNSSILTCEEAIKELMIDRKITSHSWNKLFDIQLFEDIEFPINKKFEDIGTIFKLFLKTNEISYLDMKLYGYFHRVDSITVDYSKNTTSDFIQMIRYRYDFLMKEKPELSTYINMNRVNFSTRCFLDIAMHKKIKVLEDKKFKKELYEELKIAKKLNVEEIKKINTKKLNFLNKILFLNPYIFYFIMRIYYKKEEYNHGKNYHKINTKKYKKTIA